MNNKNTNLLTQFEEQLTSIQQQLDCGIITYIDATNERNMIRDKQTKLKKKMVDDAHVTEKGAPRSISFSESKKLWQTKLPNGDKRYGVTKEALYNNLFDYYFNGKMSMTIDRAFKAVIKNMIELEAKADGTIKRLEQDYAYMITEEFAQKNVTSTTQDDIKAYFKEVASRPNMHIKRVKALKTILNKIFAYCYKEGIINKDPMYKLDTSEYYKLCTPETHNSDDNILTEPQIRALKDEIWSRINSKRNKGYFPNGFMALTSIESGARIGELCALKWSDLKENAIHIHAQQIQNRITREYYYLDSTKDEKRVSKGGRFFPLTSELKNLFEYIREKQIEIGIETEYIFARKDGSWSLAESYEHWLNDLLTKLEFGVTGNHIFRKSVNSNVLIPAGMTETDRAYLLGHSVETNLKHYSFAQNDIVERAQSVLDNYNNEVTQGLPSEKEKK